MNQRHWWLGNIFGNVFCRYVSFTTEKSFISPTPYLAVETKDSFTVVLTRLTRSVSTHQLLGSNALVAGMEGRFIQWYIFQDTPWQSSFTTLQFVVHLNSVKCSPLGPAISRLSTLLTLQMLPAEPSYFGVKVMDLWHWCWGWTSPTSNNHIAAIFCMGPTTSK